MKLSIILTIKYIEKQGEQIPANIAKTYKDEQKPNPYSGTSFEYSGHTWGMCARDNGVEILFDGKLKAYLSLEKSFIYSIYPQSELAPKSTLEAIDNIDDKEYCCILKKQDKSGLEAIKEEKVDNADNVEPKFKVGDWIIFNGLTLYIKEIVKGYYRTISKGGITNSYDWGIDNTARLWTIEDAKDGDVLFSDSACGFTFIYDGINPEGALLYSYIESNDGSPLLKYNIGKPNVGIGYATDKHIYPATKEQRDLLFAKMHGEGYEWDAEKKELKKIEDELIADVEIPFGAKDSELEEVFYSIPNGFHAEIEDDKVVIKKGEQKPAWSEEDEAKLKSIVAFLKSPSLCAMDCSKGIINENIKYLKFLKYRIQSKPESSNEHYELEEFAKIVRCNLTGISKAVQKLFESKYIQLTGKEMYGGLKD